MNNYEDHVIKGLYYIPDYLTDDEVKEIMKLLKQSKEWKSVGKAVDSRRVIHYGFNYRYDHGGIKRITDIPAFLKGLINKDRVNGYFANGIMKDDMDQLIINEYKPGQGIYAHIDHTGYFDDVIVCLNVGSAIGIDFTKDGQKRSIYVKPKSLYIMSGSARYEWRHGIAASMYDVKTKRGTRWSLTYRKVIKKDEKE